MDIAFSLPGAYHGGVSSVTQEPGFIYLYLGGVAWGWTGRCGGGRRGHEVGHGAPGHQLLDLWASPTTCRRFGVERVKQLLLFKNVQAVQIVQDDWDPFTSKDFQNRR